MKLTVDKDSFIEVLSSASNFTSNRLSTVPTLQGVLIKVEKKIAHVYATNLNAYFYTTFSVEIEESLQFIIEPRKVIEFISLLSPGKLEFDLSDKQIKITQQKTKGNFPLIVADDFPLPPAIEEKEQKIESNFLLQNLPFIVFAASSDDTRPALTGVNFLTQDDLLLVATDGFRLSLVKTKKESSFPSCIIPAAFLSELMKYLKTAKMVSFVYSPKEKMVCFTIDNTKLYSRLIDGEFPAFEKVIPTEKVSTAIVSKDELLRNVKLISVFARDYSNVIIMEFSKEGLRLRPKVEGGDENVTHQDITLEGEDQRVAFNYRYVLDFLQHIDDKNVVVELLRSNAPVVFKPEKNSAVLHIIMPVRLQE